MIFSRDFSAYIRRFHDRLYEWGITKKMVTVSLLASIAALLQSAGGYIPILGFVISPFTTLPIMIATLISFRYGSISYGLTILLLLILEPTELFVFPFTTGVLGLGLGWGLLHLRKRLAIASLNGGLLFLGICFPLYVLEFPVFGPMTSSSVSVQIITIILLFSFIYSFIWVEISLFVLQRLKWIVN